MKFKIPTSIYIILIFTSCKTNSISTTKNDPKVIRTFFSSDKDWSDISKQIIEPDKKYGFRAYVEFVSNKRNDNKNINDLKEEYAKTNYHYQFFFVVDSLTLNHKEKPILCVSIDPRDSIDRFRVIPEEMWIIENNLSIANISFEELILSVDNEGIHRANMK